MDAPPTRSGIEWERVMDQQGFRIKEKSFVVRFYKHYKSWRRLLGRRNAFVTAWRLTRSHLAL
jgi:hypothetical protein